MTTIITTGRITKDLELRKSERNGCIYVNFSLAINDGFGDGKKTMYFECTVFDAEAERLVKAKAKKGSLIQVTGKFGTSEFKRTNGEPGYSLKITVLAWSYIPGATGSQKDADNKNGNNGVNGGNAQAPDQGTETNHPAADYNGVTNLDDDDIPH